MENMSELIPLQTICTYSAYGDVVIKEGLNGHRVTDTPVENLRLV